MQSDLPVNATFWLTRINTMRAKKANLSFCLFLLHMNWKLNSVKIYAFFFFFCCSLQILQNKASRRVLLNAVSVFKLTCFCIVECMLYAYIHCVVNSMTRVAFRKNAFWLQKHTKHNIYLFKSKHAQIVMNKNVIVHAYVNKMAKLK